MRNLVQISWLVAGLWSGAASAAPLSYYLPPEETYDPAIPTPEAFMGHEVGAFVVRPDMVFAYARELDRVSDRITSEIVA